MTPLFGTDGIRGVAGQPPLDPATISRIGSALVTSLLDSGHRSPPIRVVVGCDTRESSPGIVASLNGGIVSAGGSILFAGVVPTPAVAYLVRTLGADAGISVSASHNPWADNGVKIFSDAGRKLPDEVEAEIEALIGGARPVDGAAAEAIPGLVGRYVDHLVSTLPCRLEGMRIVVDAANGAAHQVAVETFRRAGAEVIPLFTNPDGRNINLDCGALHPEAMARTTREEGADMGLALDGDADRAMVADDQGQVLDGDEILYLWARELAREGKKPDAVVGTVMSNLGLELALREIGIALHRAAVGDRYVTEMMERENTLLGGEQSGHLIRTDLTTTGDGVLTGLHVAATIAIGGRLSAQPRITRAPQILRNVKVRVKPPFDEIPGLTEEQSRCEALLDGKGRILLRYSGTESLARVMVEGTEPGVVESVAGTLARRIQEAIGA
jgi:phosphoglucosamine mutase